METLLSTAKARIFHVPFELAIFMAAEFIELSRRPRDASFEANLGIFQLDGWRLDPSTKLSRGRKIQLFAHNVPLGFHTPSTMT
jgi:hypothetical protein